MPFMGIIVGVLIVGVLIYAFAGIMKRR